MKTLTGMRAQTKILEMIQQRTLPSKLARKKLRISRLADGEAEEIVRLRISATQSLMPTSKTVHTG